MYTYNQDPGARSTEVSTCLFSADRGPGGAWRGSGTLKTGGPGARSQPGTFLRAFGGLSGEPQKGSLSADGPNMDPNWREIVTRWPQAVLSPHPLKGQS